MDTEAPEAVVMLSNGSKHECTYYKQIDHVTCFLIDTSAQAEIFKHELKPHE